MKNIINVDFQNTINSGMYCVANDTNTLDLCLTPSLVQKTNYRVEVTDTNNIVHTSKVIGLNANDQIKYQVSNAYYNGNGVMKIRLLSNESNSDYIIFNCVEFTTEDLICKYANNQYNFSVKKVNPLAIGILSFKYLLITCCFSSTLSKLSITSFALIGNLTPPFAVILPAVSTSKPSPTITAPSFSFVAIGNSSGFTFLTEKLY